MDTQKVVDRMLLRRLLEHHPDWSVEAFADTLHYSTSWVKRWQQRFRTADPTDPSVLLGHSRARHTPNPTIAPWLVERILAIRDVPPANLGRTPGPRTIAAFLRDDPERQALDHRVPVPSTIWRVLHEHDRIASKQPFDRQPVPRLQPLTSWQLDFKDSALPITDPLGKRQHVVEILNTVDVGTSLWVAQDARPDFTMATAIESCAQLVEQHGLPERINVDRDPRFLGSQLPRDVPAPFERFWIALGVEVTFSPPHHPETNAFVERLHRTLKAECLYRHHPRDLDTLRTVLGQFHHHYNTERPHQGISCANRAPLKAFPDLPTLPTPPALIDPERWVQVFHERRYTRRVNGTGSISFDQRLYYVGRRYRGQLVEGAIDGATQELVMSVAKRIKSVPLKGLVGHRLTFQQLVDHL